MPEAPRQPANVYRRKAKYGGLANFPLSLRAELVRFEQIATTHIMPTKKRRQLARQGPMGSKVGHESHGIPSDDVTRECGLTFRRALKHPWGSPDEHLDDCLSIFEKSRREKMECTTLATEATDMYLDLLKKSLTRTAFPDRYKPLKADRIRSKSFVAWAAFKCIRPALDAMRITLCSTRYNAEVRAEGRDWPSEAETMVGLERLNNVEFCVKDVLANGILGDFIETGVWRGGVCILIAAILKVSGVTDRTVWVADSFEGLPRPDGRYAQDAGSTFYKFEESLGVSLEEVRANFERYGMLDDNVRFLKGWFKDTLPGAPIDRLAVLRLDGDMYASTMDALNSLYKKLSIGGYVIIDDYGSVAACKQAVHDFRAQCNIVEPIRKIDHAGSLLEKGKGGRRRAINAPPGSRRTCFIRWRCRGP